MADEVYVATRLGGMYFSDDFTPAGAMPTWTAVNDGLPDLEILQAGMDPFTNKLYALLNVTPDIYVLNNGTWELLLSTAAVQTLVGYETGTIRWFAFDTAIPGNIYVTFQGIHGQAPFHIIKSTDYGESWTYRSIAGGNVQYAPRNIQVKNNYGYAMTNIGTGANGELRLSQDGFTTHITSGAIAHSLPVWYDWHDPSFGYYSYNSTGGAHLGRIDYGSPVQLTALQDALGMDSSTSQMWQSHLTAGHKRGLGANKLWVSYDHWVTLENAAPDAITGDAQELAYYYPDEDVVIYGRSYSPASDNATILVLADETGTVGTNRSGPNLSIPYADSIPGTSGGISFDGIQFVREITVLPEIHVHAVNLNEGETGYDPMPGDRSAWDTVDHGELHARDWDYGDTHHAPVTLDIDADVLFDLTNQVISLNSQSANTILAGPTSGSDAIDPTFRALVNADLPDPLAFKTAASALEITSGSITITQSVHVLTSGSGIVDDLSTIDGGIDRGLLIIQATDTHTVTIKHGIGNVYLNNASDFELSGSKTLLLFYDGINWSDVGGGSSGSSGGSGDMTKAVYDTDDNGIVDEAESVPWSGITGSPATFTPSSHVHVENDITNLSHNAIFIQGKPISTSASSPDNENVLIWNSVSGSWVSGSIVSGSSSSGSLTIREVDGSPSISNVTTIVVTNGTLTDSGSGIATLNIGSGSSTSGSITVRKDSGSDIGTRPRLNFISGSNITLTIADDDSDNEIDITITAASGSGTSGSGTTDILMVQIFT